MRERRDRTEIRQEPVSYGLDFTLGDSRAHHLDVSTWTKRLEELAASHGRPHMPVEVRLQGSLPVDSILDSAQTLSCDLIIMGTHGRRGISHALSGSVAQAVLRKGRCPVLTVRSAKSGPGRRQITSTALSPGMHT